VLIAGPNVFDHCQIIPRLGTIEIDGCGWQGDGVISASVGYWGSITFWFGKIV